MLIGELLNQFDNVGRIPTLQEDADYSGPHVVCKRCATAWRFKLPGAKVPEYIPSRLGDIRQHVTLCPFYMLDTKSTGTNNIVPSAVHPSPPAMPPAAKRQRTDHDAVQQPSSQPPSETRSPAPSSSIPIAATPRSPVRAQFESRSIPPEGSEQYPTVASGSPPSDPLLPLPLSVPPEPYIQPSPTPTIPSSTSSSPMTAPVPLSATATTTGVARNGSTTTSTTPTAIRASSATTSATKSKMLSSSLGKFKKMSSLYGRIAVNGWIDSALGMDCVGVLVAFGTDASASTVEPVQWLDTRSEMALVTGVERIISRVTMSGVPGRVLVSCCVGESEARRMARKTLAFRWPKVVFPICRSHQVNVLMKEVIESTTGLVSSMRDAATIAAGFHARPAWGKRLGVILEKLYGRGGGESENGENVLAKFVPRVIDYRFDSVYTCVASLLRIQTALQIFVDEYGGEVDNDAGRPFRRPPSSNLFRRMTSKSFWTELNDAARITRPIAEAALQLEVEGNTFAHTFHSFTKLYSSFARSGRKESMLKLIEEQWMMEEQPLIVLTYMLHPFFVADFDALRGGVFISVQAMCEVAKFYYVRFIGEDTGGLYHETLRWHQRIVRGSARARTVHPLHFWIVMGSLLPALSRLAKFLLSCSIQSATCKRIFKDYARGRGLTRSSMDRLPTRPVDGSLGLVNSSRPTSAVPTAAAAVANVASGSCDVVDVDNTVGDAVNSWSVYKKAELIPPTELDRVTQEADVREYIKSWVRNAQQPQTSAAASPTPPGAPTIPTPTVPSIEPTDRTTVTTATTTPTTTKTAAATTIMEAVTTKAAEAAAGKQTVETTATTATTAPASAAMAAATNASAPPSLAAVALEAVAMAISPAVTSRQEEGRTMEVVAAERRNNVDVERKAKVAVEESAKADENVAEVVAKESRDEEEEQREEGKDDEETTPLADGDESREVSPSADGGNVSGKVAPLADRNAGEDDEERSGSVRTRSTVEEDDVIFVDLTLSSDEEAEAPASVGREEAEEEEGEGGQEEGEMEDEGGAGEERNGEEMEVSRQTPEVIMIAPTPAPEDGEIGEEEENDDNDGEATLPPVVITSSPTPPAPEIPAPEEEKVSPSVSNDDGNGTATATGAETDGKVNRRSIVEMITGTVKAVRPNTGDATATPEQTVPMELETVAMTAAEEVGATTTAEGVGATTAAEGVGATTAAEEVGATTAAEEVGATTAADEVRATTAAEEVRATTAAEEVRATTAAEETPMGGDRDEAVAEEMFSHPGTNMWLGPGTEEESVGSSDRDLVCTRFELIENTLRAFQGKPDPAESSNMLAPPSQAQSKSWWTPDGRPTRTLPRSGPTNQDILVGIRARKIPLSTLLQGINQPQQNKNGEQNGRVG